MRSSATIENGRVTFWSSNCHPFEQSVAGEKATTYDAWAVHVFLNHGGDFRAAQQAEFGSVNGPISAQPAAPTQLNADPDSVLPYKPFPTDSLPECARKFVKQIAKTIDCDEAAVAVPLLAGMAVTVGNTARLSINYSWEVPSIIWTCTIAKSARLTR